ncbi:MAG: hypothetical protein G5663_02635 [Serratia symbiotica]|nr:hypothetical protein [Serratia symbiotica]
MFDIEDDAADIKQQLVTLLSEPKASNIFDPCKGKTQSGYLWPYIAARGAERVIVLTGGTVVIVCPQCA